MRLAIIWDIAIQLEESQKHADSVNFLRMEDPR